MICAYALQAQVRSVDLQPVGGRAAKMHTTFTNQSVWEGDTVMVWHTAQFGRPSEFVWARTGERVAKARVKSSGNILIK